MTTADLCTYVLPDTQSVPEILNITMLDKAPNEANSNIYSSKGNYFFLSKFINFSFVLHIRKVSF
jgi:hypothetical protein